MRLAAHVAALSMLLATPTGLHASYCGDQLVRVGVDRRPQILRRCGEPSEIRAYRVRRATTRWAHRGPIQVTPRTLWVEEWEYDFGPERLRRRFVFEDGWLVRVETHPRRRSLRRTEWTAAWPERAASTPPRPEDHAAASTRAGSGRTTTVSTTGVISSAGMPTRRAWSSMAAALVAS